MSREVDQLLRMAESLTASFPQMEEVYRALMDASQRVQKAEKIAEMGMRDEVFSEASKRASFIVRELKPAVRQLQVALRKASEMT